MNTIRQLMFLVLPVVYSAEALCLEPDQNLEQLYLLDELMEETKERYDEMVAIKIGLCSTLNNLGEQTPSVCSNVKSALPEPETYALDNN